MAVKGAQAKAELEKQLSSLPNFIGISDKKIFYRMTENGDYIYLKVAITGCKEVPEFDGVAPAEPESAFPAVQKPTRVDAVELSAEEKERVEELFNKLGL